MDEITKDSRFSHIEKDPRFKKMSRQEKKVKIDKRFQSMFTDEKFKVKGVVDKRGRPHVSQGSKHLEQFYDLSESSDTESEDNEEKNNLQQEHKEVSETEHQNISFKRENLPPEIKAKIKGLVVDYARGEGCLYSESSSDEDSSSCEEEEEAEHNWGELDKEADVIEETTARLALCNMDWDRITASDIMVLMHSFLPPQGVLQSVTVYPSEFGLKRLKEEEEKGPTELTSNETNGEMEDDEMNEAQREKLREYQLKRLRYYYAVLVFDSPKTADHIYKSCDGLEYESSMNRLDLRFIPDDTEFEQVPREECREMPNMSTYKPRLYRTTALTQVKVDLTWDETDPAREEVIRLAHQGKLDDSKIGAFLASSSDESDDADTRQPDVEKDEPERLSESKAIDKYKALLADLGKKEEEEENKEVAMEVTWDLQLEKKTAEKVKEATKAEVSQTPFEEYLAKRKEKKKLKKEQRSAAVAGDENEEPFSDDEIPSDIDLNDPYFKQELGTTKKKKNKEKQLKSDNEDENEQNKAELELLMLDEINEESKQHFSLKKIEDSEKKSKKRRFKKKKKQANVPVVEDDFKMDVKDERFSAIFTSHLYNVDPAAPHFKPTLGMKSLLAEKSKRKFSQETTDVMEAPATSKQDAELNLLVKSVKSKTANARKRQKI